jgi:predicted Na+-dependent transporter
MLQWVGQRSRWVLVIGCLLAFTLPQLSGLMRPALPALVSLVLAMAMIRVDMAEFFHSLMRPKDLLRLLLLTFLIMPATALISFAGFKLLAIDPKNFALLLLFSLAPPISSAASLCFIMGLNARLALHITLVTILATPLIGPAMIAWMLPEAAPISTLELGWRLAQIILGALAISFLLRRLLGAVWIARQKIRLDGLSVLIMILFLIPVFDGVAAQILRAPLLALGMLVFCFALNLGANMAAYLVSARLTDPLSAGALGVVWGNRMVTIYLAALPPDPYFTLFVALYQIPMFLTPLLAGRLFNAENPDDP